MSSENRVVRVGDVWRNRARAWRVDGIVDNDYDGRKWGVDSLGDHFMVIADNGEPLFDGWTLVSRKAER